MSDVNTTRGKKVLIHFEGKRCIHARECVTSRPDVFVPNGGEDWIHPDAADPAEIAALAYGCPSGAIQYERIDGGPNEQAPGVNTAKVRENGPIALRGDLRLEGKSIGFRATICRCGASANKPYCDGSHTTAGFSATGEPVSVICPELAERAGPLDITPTPDGPLKVAGNLELLSSTGRMVKRAAQTFLCRCGSSANKPFCDGSHKKVGWKSEP